MRTTTEMEIKVSGGRIICAEVKDVVCKLVIEVAEEKSESLPEVKKSEPLPEAKNPEDMFVLIEASKLRLDDEFMQYEPQTPEESKFKELLKAVIRRGVKDFYRPRIDPSFTEDGTGIRYEAGKKPAVDKFGIWWDKVAKNFNPACHSRLGTKSEYIAFLGVLIKTLIVEGWSVEDAWYAVCNDSRKLGHYWTSKKAKDDFEPTGSREVAGFFDLANTYKILADDEGNSGFWRASGCYTDAGEGIPLARWRIGNYYVDKYYKGVGWLVFEGITDY